MVDWRLVKRSAVHEVAREAGGAFATVEGWLVVEEFDSESQGVAAEVALVDRSARAKVLVDGEAASAVVARAWGVPALDVNGGATFEDGIAYRLRRDRYFVSAPPGAEGEIVAAAQAAVREEDGLITVTDVTHGRAEMWLVGRKSAELLSRLCGLDFHSDRFPTLTARQSSVAKTAQLVIRSDMGQESVYALIGARSFGAYLWQTILDGARDLDLQIHGEQWLRAVREKQEDHAGS